jgi:MFS family permease
VTGSIIFPQGQSMAVLIVGRIFQGVGAAGIDLLSEIMLAITTSLHERPRYESWPSISMDVGIVVGLLLEAAFADHGGATGHCRSISLHPFLQTLFITHASQI